MPENKFQHILINDLKTIFKGCIILKNDPNYLQGFPDLLILYKNKWAALEVKDSFKARKQPNQRYWIDYANDLSFAAFIFPENKDEVLNELQQAFGLIRFTRFSRSK